MSKKLKLSPWHNWSVMPVHKGVYETGGPFGSRTYQYWNGEYWGSLSFSKLDAYKYRHYISLWQNFPWRGIIK